MKKLKLNLPCAARRVAVASGFLLLLIQSVFAQKPDTLAAQPATPMYDIYMQRHKTNKTVAWVFLSAGVATAVAGLVDAGSSGGILSSNFDTGVTLMFVGALVAVPSIPFFIMAGKNKKKAMLELKSGTIAGPGSFRYAAVALKINL